MQLSIISSICFQSKTLTLQTLGTYRVYGVNTKGYTCLESASLESEAAPDTIPNTGQCEAEERALEWENLGALGSATGELCELASQLTPLTHKALKCKTRIGISHLTELIQSS